MSVGQPSAIWIRDVETQLERHVAVSEAMLERLSPS
jgi:hypothetical protein